MSTPFSRVTTITRALLLFGKASMPLMVASKGSNLSSILNSLVLMFSTMASSSSPKNFRVICCPSLFTHLTPVMRDAIIFMIP